MKLLKISENEGQFLNGTGSYEAIDKITKEELLRLVNLTLTGEEITFDDFDEASLKNLAHRVIYKSVSQKLRDLRARKREFTDEAARLFLEDYEKYRQG